MDALCNYPVSYSNQILPALLKAIEAASSYTTEREIFPILNYIFQGKKVDVTKGKSDLSIPQISVLLAIYTNPSILGTKLGNVGLALKTSIGMEDNKAVWKQLLES